MTPQFTALNLRPELEQAITALGYEEPTPIQAGIIPLMLEGNDVIGQAQTGTGKTAAFALPILHNLQEGLHAPQALILAPTRELALQVANAFDELGKFCHARVCAIYGGSSYSRQIGQLKRGVDIVVGTPGRLLDLLNRSLLDLSTIHSLVLDEADEMLSMGFIEDIETLMAATPTLRQTALFSATLPAPIRRLAEKYMNEPQSVTIQRERITVDAIEQRYYIVRQDDKTAALTRLFEIEEISSALIFVRTRAGTGELANELSNRGFPAEALNGDLSQEARERTLNRFRQDQVKVLVATDVAARGLDIEGISHVFNYDMPYDTESYVHRIGRTGRAGKSGTAISLMTPYERRRLREIEKFTHQRLIQNEIPTVEEIQAHRDTELVKQVNVWLQRGRCRKERTIIETMVAEGIDPLEVAAAALKIARAQEKKRPIATINPIAAETNQHFRRGRYSRREKRSYAGQKNASRHERGIQRKNSKRGTQSSSHETGMVRLTMNMGKAHGIRPADVVGAIAYHADIPGSTIGKIHIEDQQTLVDVPENLVGQVLAKTGKYIIRKQTFAIERA